VWDGSNLPTQSNMDTALSYNETAAQICELGSNVDIARCNSNLSIKYHLAPSFVIYGQIQS
jgi:hypothetical protein